MKVFLSWSGERSHKVACAFREWLPSVIQSIEAYVSSEDIEKGARWSGEIAKELDNSHYGIICLTEENKSAPWIHFEAGALSKSMKSGCVSPFLIDIKRSDVQGPLTQFQSVIFEKTDVLKLVVSINEQIPEKNRLTEATLSKSFERWWPQLEDDLHRLEQHADKPKPMQVDEKTRILEDIRELVLQQQRILNSPETLLPQEYVYRIMEPVLTRQHFRPPPDIQRAYEDLCREHTVLVERTQELPESHPERERMKEALAHLERRIVALRKRGYRLPKGLAKSLLDGIPVTE